MHSKAKRIFLAAILLLMMVSPGRSQVMGGPEFARPITEDKLPSTLPIKGELIEARVWRQQGKLQLLVFSELKHPGSLRNDIYLAQYEYHRRKLELVWSVKEFAKSLCKVEFYPNSLQIIDLDGDGLYETSFIYLVQCETEEPAQGKLMLFRKGEKYAVRGHLALDPRRTLDKESDAGLDQLPAIYHWFMKGMWTRYFDDDDLVPATLVISARGKDWMLLEWGQAQNQGHELLTPEGELWNPSDPMADMIHYADHVEAMPDSSTLFFVTRNKVGVFSPNTGDHDFWLELAKDNEGISPPAWSPDRTRVAFTALNINVFPELTRLFVFDLAENQVVDRQTFDLSLETTSFFSSLDFTPPEFLNDSTLVVKTAGPDGMADGGEKEIHLQKAANK